MLNHLGCLSRTDGLGVQPKPKKLSPGGVQESSSSLESSDASQVILLGAVPSLTWTMRL